MSVLLVIIQLCLEVFFSSFRMHSDKETIKKRKKNYLTHLLQYKERQAAIAASFSQATSALTPCEDTLRILRKLAHRRGQWSAAKQAAEPWIPTQKMARSMLTSSSALQKLTRKIDLQVNRSPGK